MSTDITREAGLKCQEGIRSARFWSWWRFGLTRVTEGNGGEGLVLYLHLPFGFALEFAVLWARPQELL